MKMNFNPKLKKQLLGVALIVSASIAPSAANASCYIDRYAPSQYATPTLSGHTAAVIATLKAMDIRVAKAMNDQARDISSAVDILTQQKAVSTKQFSTAMKNNSQLEAQAMQEMNRSKRIKKAIRDYGVRSMGYKACEVSAKRKVIQQTAKNTDAAIPLMVNTEVTAKPGMYGSRKEAAAVRLALHDKYYCTPSQASSGLCSATGSEAGKSLQAVTLLTPSGKDTQEYVNKSAFINNMVGLPDDPVPQSIASSAQAQSYSDLKRRKDAIKSTAITSLKAIQAQTSAMDGEEPEDDATLTESVASERKQLAANAPKDKDAKIEKAPLIQQIKEDVSRYLGGGEEYSQWSKSLASAEEKGVLTELVKIKALSLYLQAEKYKQYSRMEAMLAANVAAQTVNSGMEGDVEASRQVAMRQHIKDSILSNKAQ